MAQSEYMQQLNEKVRALPRGWQKDVTGGDASKKVLLRRALRREGLFEMTDGEITVFNDMLEWLKDQQRKNNAIKKEVLKVVAQ